MIHFIDLVLCKLNFFTFSEIKKLGKISGFLDLKIKK